MEEINKFDKLKQLNLLESHRKETFKDWPYDQDSSCNVDKMAEAGFYWCGDNVDRDTVKCFVCGKTLTGWDPEDDPWQEHIKHAPQCPFVKYNRKEEELTLEEFLQLFNTVTKNTILQIINNNKNKFTKEAYDDLDTFNSEKKS